jgi:hypothetical protein
MLVRSGECMSLTAVIDRLGTYHVAAVCDGGIRYLTSKDGIDWNETSFPPAIDRLELDPQLTLDGNTVYLAYSLLAPTDGACGDDGLQDVGVYTRSAKLPNGAWSDPVRIGAVGDRVQSFRVAGGTLYLTVTAKDGGGPLFYESQAGSTLTRIALPGAVSTSLRVGDDGHARIAYSTDHAIRYARVDGSKLSTVTVTATDETYLQAPTLVLGPGDDAYMVWTQSTDGGGGCAGPEPGPLDGVYFGTDAGGRWKSARLTRTPGEASLTLDPVSGRIEAIANDGSSLARFASVGGTDWTAERIPGTRSLINAVIRLNPLTGRVSVLAMDFDKGIYLLTGA